MTQIYATVQKPTAQNYANLNTQGKQQYDEADILYDSANVFYDSVNQNQYTDIAKPALLDYTNTTWAQAAFAWSSAAEVWSIYTDILKPS